MRIQQAFDNLKKYKKIYIIAAAVFFGLGAAVQITAIKLAGGFFYCREIVAAPAVCSNYASRYYLFEQPPSTIGGGRQSLGLLPLRQPNWFALPGCLFSFLIVCLSLFVLTKKILPPVNSYGRTGFYVRPPTVFKNRVC